MSTLAPFIQGSRQGIYVLEFSNGEQYVGQARDVTTRFTTHRRGSTHHPAWRDIVAVSFLPAAREQLDKLEREEIDKRRRQGIPLRNKTFNFPHSQPSPIDAVFPTVTHDHWASGDTCYGWPRDHRGVPVAPDVSALSYTRRSRFSEWCFHHDAGRTFEAIVADLTYIIETLIPSPQLTESRYWTLSDFPSTAGGRFATLNVGQVELAYFPRHPIPIDRYQTLQHCLHLNLTPTFLQPPRFRYFARFSGRKTPSKAIEHKLRRAGLPFAMSWAQYSIAKLISIAIPIGSLEKYCTAAPELIPAARILTLDLMRHNQAGLFRRWHSTTLLLEVLTQGFGAQPIQQRSPNGRQHPH